MAKEKLEVQVTTQGADRAARELDQVAKKADEVDGKKVGLDLSGLVGAGGGLAALGAGMGLLANNTADAAIEADNLARLTGDSVEQASRLNAVWKQGGAESKDLQDVLLQMNGVLATNADLAAELGVNLEDGATVGQRFEQVAAALDKIPDAAKRSQIASQVFGEEGVRQYNALRGAVGDLSEALEDVPSGSVFTDEDVEQARKMKAEFAELRAEAEGLAAEVGSRLLPVVNGLIDGFKNVLNEAGSAGESLRSFLTGGGIVSGSEQLRAVEASIQAAKDYDQTLLDGLSTFEQVHAAVLEHTGDLTTANVVATEWANANREAEAAVSEHLEALRIGPTFFDQFADAFQTAVDTFKTAAEDIPRALERALSAAEERTEEFQTRVADAIQAVFDRVAEADQKVRDRLELEGLLDDIKEQFGEVNEAADKVAEDGEEGARRHREALRTLRTMLLDLVQDVDHLSANDKIRFTTEIERGSVDDLFRLLGELQQGVTVPVSFSQPAPPSVTGSLAGFTGGGAPVFNGVQSAIPAGNVTIIYPVGSTPTTTTQNQIDYIRRNGQW